MKLLLISELNVPSIIIAFISRIYFDKIIYLDATPRFKKESLLAVLKKFKVEIIDYGRFRFYDVDQMYSRQNDIALGIYRRLYSEAAALERIIPLFGHSPRMDLKLKVAIIDMLSRLIGMLPELLVCTDYFQAHYQRVCVYIKRNSYLDIGMEDYTKLGVRNLYPSAFNVLLFLWALGKKLYRVLMRARRTILNAITADTELKTVDTHQTVRRDWKILYFPHQGILYGNLFLKDQFYSNDPENPFYKGNIFHIEYQKKGLNKQLLKNIVNYYNEKNIPYDFLVKTRNKRAWRKFVRFILRNGKTLFQPMRFSLSRIRLIWRIYRVYLSYYTYLSQFKHAKIALIGYDVLFPKTASLALSVLNIPTIATQERFIQTFMKKVNVLLDYYFVQGDLITESLENCESSYTGSMIPIGPIRLDILHEYRQREYSRVKRIKRKYNLVVAFDYHSDPKKIEGNLPPIVNWENNKAFYKDMIRLAMEMPSLYIIIRGKDDKWCEIPSFKETYDIVASLPNMEINREYDQPNVSYMLTGAADLLVVRHTSIGDEALAAGIPVLFYDFTKNAEKVISSLFDYEKHPVFVYSYQQLRNRVEKIIEKTEFMPEDEFEKMRKRFYGGEFNGTVKNKLHSWLMKIFVEQTEKKNGDAGMMGFRPEPEKNASRI
jgi:hypothetical protein